MDKQTAPPSERPDSQVDQKTKNKPPNKTRKRKNKKQAKTAAPQPNTAAQPQKQAPIQFSPYDVMPKEGERGFSPNAAKAARYSSHAPAFFKKGKEDTKTEKKQESVVSVGYTLNANEAYDTAGLFTLNNQFIVTVQNQAAQLYQNHHSQTSRVADENVQNCVRNIIPILIGLQIINSNHKKSQFPELIRLLEDAKTLKVAPFINKMLSLIGDFKAKEGKFRILGGVNAGISAIAQGNFTGFIPFARFISEYSCEKQYLDYTFEDTHVVGQQMKTNPIPMEAVEGNLALLGQMAPRHRIQYGITRLDLTAEILNIFGFNQLQHDLPRIVADAQEHVTQFKMIQHVFEKAVPIKFPEVGGMPCQLVSRVGNDQVKSAFILRDKDVQVGAALNIGQYSWMTRQITGQFEKTQEMTRSEVISSVYKR